MGSVLEATPIKDEIEGMKTAELNKAVEDGKYVRIGTEVASDLTQRYGRKMTRQVLWKAANQGRIDAAQVGESFYTTKAALDDYMATLRKSAVKE